MRVKRTIVVLIVLCAWCLFATRMVAAQVSAPASLAQCNDASGASGRSEPRNDERSTARSADGLIRMRSNLGFSRVTRATIHGPSVGNASVGHLRNPFEWGGHAPKRGLFGLGSPQQEPTPQFPGPGAMPGAPGPEMEGAPGPGAAAGAAAAPGAPTPGAAIPGADEFAAGVGAAGPGFGGGLGAGSEAFAMIGDISPVTLGARFGVRTSANPVSPPGPPPPPGARGASPIYPSVRNFKISENMSPRPQDRVYFNFNYYNGLNNTVNLKDLSPITRMKAYIYNFGVEKPSARGWARSGCDYHWTTSRPTASTTSSAPRPQPPWEI